MKILISVDSQGRISIDAPSNPIAVIGLLELAKDVYLSNLKAQAAQSIVPAPASALDQLGKAN